MMRYSWVRHAAAIVCLLAAGLWASPAGAREVDAGRERALVRRSAVTSDSGQRRGLFSGERREVRRAPVAPSEQRGGDRPGSGGGLFRSEQRQAREAPRVTPESNVRPDRRESLERRVPSAPEVRRPITRTDSSDRSPSAQRETPVVPRPRTEAQRPSISDAIRRDQTSNPKRVERAARPETLRVPSSSADRERSTSPSRQSVSRQIARPGDVSQRIGRTTDGQNQGQSRIPEVSRSQSPVSRRIERERPTIDRGEVTRRPDATGERRQASLRSRQDVTRSIARPSTSDTKVRRSDTQNDVARRPVESAQPSSRIRRPDGERSGTTAARPDVTRTPAGTDRSRTAARPRDDISQSLRRMRPDTEQVGRESRIADRTRGTGRVAEADRIPRDAGRMGSALIDRKDARSASRLHSDAGAISGSRSLGRETAARDVSIRTAGRDRDVQVLSARRYATADRARSVQVSGRIHADVRVSGRVDVTHVRAYYPRSRVFVHDVLPHYHHDRYYYVSSWHGYHGHSYLWSRHHHSRDWFLNISFSYYSTPAVVEYAAVRYVYPVTPVYVAPAVVYYDAVVVPPVYTPIIYSAPVYLEPVVYRPVVMPVITPMIHHYHPVVYYPAYAAVVTTPAYVVEPAPVKTFSFGFGYADGGRAIGASVAVAKREPPVVAVPAVAEVAAIEPEPEPDYLGAGLEQLRNGDPEDARRLLSQAVLDEPDNGTARMLYTAALMADGHYSDAAISLRRTLQVWPTVTLADFYLPGVYGDEEAYRAYSRDLRAWLSDYPERGDAWLLAIWSYAFGGQPQEAMILLAEARRAWPADPDLITLERLIREDLTQQQQQQAAAEGEP